MEIACVLTITTLFFYRGHLIKICIMCVTYFNFMSGVAGTNNTNIVNLAIKSGSDHKSDPVTTTALMPTITMPERFTLI